MPSRSTLHILLLPKPNLRDSFTTQYKALPKWSLAIRRLSGIHIIPVFGGKYMVQQICMGLVCGWAFAFDNPSVQCSIFLEATVTVARRKGIVGQAGCLGCIPEDELSEDLGYRYSSYCLCYCALALSSPEPCEIWVPFLE